MANKKSILAVNLTADVNERLENLSRQTGLAKNAIARLAIEAAIQAGEKHGGKLVVPIEFEVSHQPARVNIPTGLALAAEDPAHFRKSRNAG